MGTRLIHQTKQLSAAQQMRRIVRYCKTGIIQEDEIVECAGVFYRFDGLVHGRPQLTKVDQSAIKAQPIPAFRDGFDMEAAIERVKE